MSVQVTVENAGDIARLIQTLPAEIFTRLQQVLANGTIRLAERARELAPVRTGRLMASIYADLGEESEINEAFLPYQVVAETEYATFVEFGTSRMAAHPFMGPAAEELEPEILGEVDSILSDLGLVREAGIEH